MISDVNNPVHKLMTDELELVLINLLIRSIFDKIL